MWKKTLPIIGLSAILLVACNNNGDVPNNNEIPMPDVHEDENQGQNNNNGNMSRDENNLNQDGSHVNENDENPQVEIIEDLNRKNDIQE